MLTAAERHSLYGLSDHRMTRDQLIGSWQCTRTHSVIELRPDGTGVTRTNLSGFASKEERIEWSHTDAVHWYLGVFIDPVPHIPSLENGTIQGINYTVVAEDDANMSLTDAEDDDIVWVWRRIDAPTG